MICDFCSDPVPDDPEHTVFIERPLSYTVGPVTYKDSVDWAVCDACLPLVKNKDKAALIERVIVKYKEHNPDGWYEGAEIALEIYLNKFWRLYIPMEGP